MDIVNQMIEGEQNGATANKPTSDPNDILNSMTSEAQAADDKSKETPSAEESGKQAEIEKEALAQKEKEALKAKEKEEKKDLVLDENKEPVLNELGDKVKKDDVPVEKEWFETEPATPGSPEAKNEDEVKKKEISAKLDKLAEIEKVLADPEIEAFIAAKKTGKGIKEFYNEVVGTDYDSLSPEALNEIDLKRNGIEGDELIEANEAFAALPNWEKRKQTNGIKAQLKAQQAESLKRFTVDAKAQQEANAQMIQKQMQEADAFAKQIIGQKKFGIEITPGIAHDVKQAVVEGVKDFFNEDGTLNLVNFSDAVILYKHREAIVAANVKKALNKGKGEVLADVTRASKNETVNRVPDEKSGKKTEYDRVDKEFFGQYAKTH